MVEAIETEELTKWYGANLGIEQLTMTVRRGEVFGFLGPNGAGKSTTIRTLLDFQRATSGRARVLGLDCREDSVALRQKVGYLPGELTLFEGMTGHQLVSWCSRARGGHDELLTAEMVERLRHHFGSAGARVVQGQQAEGRAVARRSCIGPRW